jgi:hypothetical protein
MSEKFTGFTPPFTIIDDEIYDAKGFLLTSCLTNNQLNYITQRLNTYEDIQKQNQGMMEALEIIFCGSHEDMVTWCIKRKCHQGIASYSINRLRWLIAKQALAEARK